MTTGIYPSITVSLLTADIDMTNKTNSAITTYTFTLSQPPPFSTGSKILITFPSTIVPQSNVSCTDGLGAALLSCSYSGLTLTAGLLSNVSNSNFLIIVSNVKNSPSLRPSNTFTIITQTSNSFSYSSNLVKTVTNTLPSKMSSLNGTFSPATLSTSTTLTLTFTPSTTATSAVVTLASSFTLGTISCSPSCTNNGYIVTITGSFSTSTTVTITGITSPSSTPTDQSSVATY